MKQTTFYPFAFILSIVMTISCNGQKGNQNRVDNKIDSIVRDIPKSQQDKLRRAKKEKLDEALGLNSLENGFNGLQIRIWRGYSTSDTGRLIILTNKNSNWSAELITFNYFFLDSGATIAKNVIKKNPVAGWKTFISKLFTLGILELPDYHEIPNYRLPTDADGVEVEYANKNKYRVYTYGAPDMFVDKIPEARNVVQILKMIENEFDFRGFLKLSDR